MYVDRSTLRVRGKVYTRFLLRESYREDGKVKHRTLLNLSRCRPEEIAAVELALKHKGNLAALGDVRQEMRLRQGPSFGAVWTLWEMAQRTGVAAALGKGRAGRLALWQVLARVIDQGSRLSAVRLAGGHAACDVLELGPFDEDDLYANLDWLAKHQATIEQRLFAHRHGKKKPALFLYDVTSSYLEGQRNELAAFGYNRDGKRGKRQIVIGLLTDEGGMPLSVEVFPGNTADPTTFRSQVRKVAERFGGGEVTFVGDRGMIKSRQVENLAAEGFHYITAITKPQIETLLGQGVLQLGLFDATLAEVTPEEGPRYVLRRNPLRAAEIAAGRRDKLQCVTREVEKQNAYLAEHGRASVAVAHRNVAAKIERLRLSGWLRVAADGRRLSLVEDHPALAEASKLDGCYCLKTDLTPAQATKEIVHDRYKDLAGVEWAFRTCKTVHLEARPVYVRRASRTRGHALVVMLAYLLVAELTRCWERLDVTVPEGIAALTTLCTMEVSLGGEAPTRQQTRFQRIPEPNAAVAQLLSAATIRLPSALPSRGSHVTTKRKLPSRRKTR
jgi:hypothetical protein